MKTGISIYLSSPLQDIERTIEHGAAAGARYAFTSLHIPEDGGAAYADKVRHVMSLLSARGIALIADVGPRTCDLLGLERIEDLRDLGLEYLRLDYGFSAQRVAELSGVFRIVVNASTVSSDEIASWREAGADVTRFAACHNFYPKPYTGLALEDIARVNLRLAALGFEIMAFVPGDANVRGPVFEGLPTVEAQRGRASKVALNMLELAHGADCDIVLVGDPDLSDAGWAQLPRFPPDMWTYVASWNPAIPICGGRFITTGPTRVLTSLDLRSRGRRLSRVLCRRILAPVCHERQARLPSAIADTDATKASSRLRGLIFPATSA